MQDYAVSRPLQRAVMQDKKKRKQISARDATAIAAKQKATGLVLKGSHELLKHAAQSQIKGRIGIGLRVGGRIGLRVVPVVGAALLAYDLYQAYQYLTD